MDLPLRNVKWNEIQVVASETCWTIEVAQMLWDRYQEVYRRERSKACKQKEYLCVINMAAEGLVVLAEELKEQWFDPKKFSIRVLVNNKEAASLLRGEEVSMVARNGLAACRRAMSQFSQVSVMLANQPSASTVPSAHSIRAT